MATPEKIQQDIIEEFSFLMNDHEAMLYYLIELGEKLPPLTSNERISKYLIPGCISSVWLIPEIKNKHLFLKADSNTAITKGLISLLIRIFSGQKLSTIHSTQLFILSKLPLMQVIGSQRLGGFSMMVKKIYEIIGKSK